MNLKKIEEIKNLAKKKGDIFINDVVPIIKSSRIMALNYLLEMQIMGILERIETRKTNKYSYKKWRLKKDV
jgi:hypothetical protein